MRLLLVLALVSGSVLGGAIVTAGGIAFIGAAMDHVLRAFDVETGKELWAGPLPAGASDAHDLLGAQTTVRRDRSGRQ